MKWSWKLGTFAGIPVHIHATFLVLLIWIGAIQWIQTRNFPSVLAGILFTTAIFTCVTLHEYGHALMARRFGVRTKDITLLPIGGLARLEHVPEKPREELWIAIAGPLVNLAIAAILGIHLVLSARFEPLAQLGFARGSFVERLFVANVFLAGFNLIPAFPMDGGRILRALLATRWDYLRATKVAATIGQCLALAFGLGGLFGNPFLIFVAFFVWIGAAQEGASVEAKSSLTGVLVQDVIVKDFSVVSPDDELSKVVDLILTGWQQDFPVLAKEHMVGMLTRSNLIATVAKVGVGARVREAMGHDFPITDPTESLGSALSRLQGSQTKTMSVLKDGQLVGLLSLDNVSEYLLVQEAIRGAAFSLGAPQTDRVSEWEISAPTVSTQRSHSFSASTLRYERPTTRVDIQESEKSMRQSP